MKRLLVLLIASTAYAQEAPEAPPPDAPPVPSESPPAPPAPAAPSPEELAKRIEALEEQTIKVEELEQRTESLKEQLAKVTPLRGFIKVFLDVGWFSVGGNGAGVRPDIGHRYVSDHGGVPAEWVLIGDPLSTTINSLGEPADLGATRSIETDTIDSDGNPTFIVNTVGLPIGRQLTEKFSIASLVELLPRTGPDELVVEFAHVDYRPSNKVDFRLSAGKVDSVLGIEYRAQDAPKRVGITPSLLCRYTCGRPYGVRAQYVHEDSYDLSALISTGDMFQERFEQDPRLASAKAPTIAAHAQYILPTGKGVVFGISGAFGPQDGQSTLRVHQWHYGVDLRVREHENFELQAEYVQGKQQGSSTGLYYATQAMPDPDVVAPPCSVAQCLRYKAAYGMASYRVTEQFTPYARVDWRDARHQRGVDFLYVSRVIRGTVGAQYAVTKRILGKLEYTYNRELLGPQFPNDVLTTSIVVSTE